MWNELESLSNDISVQFSKSTVDTCRPTKEVPQFFIKSKKNLCLITARSLRAGMRTLALPENCKEPPINITLPCYPSLHLYYTNSTVSFYSTYVKLLIKLGAMD